ncbi:MAG: COX15/CtaA family protein, partial [Pseudomonadales bacterium]|nr:COX15/CtaA family protein [Pseudomonadales bacterium]
MIQDRFFRLCTVFLLAAILSINLLSSYIRHHEAGLDCDPWPACYGVIGVPTAAASAETAIEQALTPAQSAKRAHRAIATALVVLVLVVTFHARSRLPTAGSAALLPYLLIAVVLFLSVIGPASYLKTLPAVASANLIGGMVLLALTWILWLITGQPAAAPPVPLSSTLVRVALAALSVQIALGSWVSANFAGTAC